MTAFDSDQDTATIRVDHLRADRPGIDITIPGYELMSIIGAGGMGVVYCARQTALDRVVALKIVKFSKQKSANALARFLREARAVARFRHPNIVTAYDCGEHDGVAYYTMELLEGKSLDVRLRELPLPDEYFTWNIIRQAVAGLSHACEEGIIHRDIKPGNFFLAPAPTGYPLPLGIPLVKVTDFGLAIFRDTDEREDLKLTQSGMLVGTPMYMAPELFESVDAGLRSDMYSLGITAFEMLLGKTPFEAKNIWELIQAKKSIEWAETPNIGFDSLDLIRSMTARNPDDRPATYGEILNRIDAILAKITPIPRTTSKITRVVKPATVPHKAKWIWSTIGLVLVALIIIVALRNRSSLLSEPKEYKPGAMIVLFGKNSMSDWKLSGKWELTNDAEKGSVFSGRGSSRIGIPSEKDVRVSLAVDLHKADVVELQFAIRSTGSRLVLQISKAGGVLIGRRAGDESPFVPIPSLTTIPFPKSEDSPYNEMRVERIGINWYAWFNNKYLGGWKEGKCLGQFILVAAPGEALFDQIQIEEMRLGEKRN